MDTKAFTDLPIGSIILDDFVGIRFVGHKTSSQEITWAITGETQIVSSDNLQYLNVENS